MGTLKGKVKLDVEYVMYELSLFRRNNLVKLKKTLWIIGLLFMLLYSVYIAGYSTSPIFKYALLIGVLFWTIELLIEIIEYLISLFRKIQKKNH